MARKTHRKHSGGTARTQLARTREKRGDARPSFTVAIVGRPNVGKSSLLNRILGENRVLVSPVAGTTRDPIDTLVERDGKRFLFIDTAGIRRRAKVSGTPEDLADAILFLCSDQARSITGQTLDVNGGRWFA